ncbi:hypothetical protein GGI21_004696 [Coemansia aciculifera]|nr:hypothetical protein GGI21_004696 [Coemansia aciculifera]
MFLAGGVIAGTGLYFGLKRYISNCRIEILGQAAEEAEGFKGMRALLDACPSLTDPTQAYLIPTAYLCGGMLQTAYSSIQTLKRDSASDIVYDREPMIMSDGGTISLDWYPQRATDSSQPIVIIMSGVGGSSYEYHIRCLAKTLDKAGFCAVVMNHRGLGRTPLTSPKLYNGGDTSDFRDTVQYIHDSFPEAPLLGVAFSMGAMLLTKYMGEPSALLAGGIVICCPFDMTLTGRLLDADTFANKLSRPLIVSSQLRIVKRNYDMVKSAGYDMDALMRATRMSEIDTIVTAKACGFKDCWELYEAGGTAKYVDHISAPYLVINTMDDPVVPPRGLPLDKIKSNPNTAVAMLKHGGHLGFFTGNLTPRIWYLTPVVEFLQAVVKLPA